MKELEIRETCRCGAKIGENHDPGCDIERCPECGGQIIACPCHLKYFGFDLATLEEEHPDIYRDGLPEDMDAQYEEYIRPHLLPWDGAYPGVRECREYNLWSKWTDNGWQVCSVDDPDAGEDLNALAMRSTWDKEKRRYVISSWQNR